MLSISASILSIAACSTLSILVRAADAPAPTFHNVCQHYPQIFICLFHSAHGDHIVLVQNGVWAIVVAVGIRHVHGDTPTHPQRFGVMRGSFRPIVA